METKHKQVTILGNQWMPTTHHVLHISCPVGKLAFFCMPIAKAASSDDQVINSIVGKPLRFLYQSWAVARTFLSFQQKEAKVGEFQEILSLGAVGVFDLVSRSQGTINHLKDKNYTQHVTAYLLSFRLKCVTGNTLVYISVSGVTGPSHLLQVGKYMETCQTLFTSLCFWAKWQQNITRRNPGFIGINTVLMTLKFLEAF